MKKILTKFINILLIISLVIVPNTAFALTETEVKAGASKGDIYDPEANTVGNSATINENTCGNKACGAGDVEVQKIVRKTNTLGKYEVEFKIKGHNITEGQVVTNPVYVVMVLDASNSMDNPSIEKWNNAVQGVKNFAVELQKKVSSPKPQFALVKFAGKSSNKNFSDAVPIRGFSTDNFNNTDIGGLGVNGGATNLGEGLRQAYYLFKNSNIPSNATKYVVVLSDGVPTIYTDENGNSGTTSESEWGKRYDTKSHEYATTWANKIKSKNDLGASLISVGYELNSLEFSKDRQKAYEVLREIASGSSFFIDTEMDDVVSSMKNLTSKVDVEYYAGTDVKLQDKLGKDFTLTSGNTTLKAKNITNNWQSLGKFYINIDQTVDTGWYETNDGFTLTYTDYKNKIKTITSDRNPEVYWVNKYNYTVNYYKDEITNQNDKTHFINGYTDKADNKEVIKKSDIDLNKYIPEGYYLEGMYNEAGTQKIDSLTVDKTKSNVINILYKIKKFDYTVNYYYADLNNNYHNPDITKQIKDVPYGTNVKTENHYLKKDEIRQGYSLDENTTQNITYRIVDNKVVIDIYYKRNSYGYTVNYHFNNNKDNNLTLNSSAIYGSTLYANNKYLENINPLGLSNKNIADNTIYFLEPYNDNNISSILIGTNPLLNVLNLFYVSTGFENETIDKEADKEVITNSSDSVTYTVDYNSVINNVRKDEIITVTIVDKLPAKIDETNLKTNLNDGIYNEEENTITWTFEEKAEDFTKEYKVSKSIEYSVVYKDFADISACENNKLINNVTGITTIGNISTLGVTDEDSISVEIKGKVIVHYVTKDGKKLTDSIEIENYVGSNYETIKKEFDKYSFLELIGEPKGKIVEGVTEITYVYDLTPLPPYTGVNTRNLDIYCYITFIISSGLAIIYNRLLINEKK